MLRKQWGLEIIPTTWLPEILNAQPITEDVDLHQTIFEIKRGNLEFIDGTNPWIEPGWKPGPPTGYEWVLLHRWGDRHCSTPTCQLEHCKQKRKAN